jgi:hypothetical protein
MKKSVEKLQIWLKSDRSIWHLTGRPKCLILLAAEVCSATMERKRCAFSIYFVESLRQQCKGIVSFQWKQWLHDRATVLG